jgi:hypothetical protein
MITEMMQAHSLQPAATRIPASSTLEGFEEMDLVNQYIMGHLTLAQTNELLARKGYRRVLTIIEKKLY